MAACGCDFTGLVTEDGEVWACGVIEKGNVWACGEDDALGHGNHEHQLAPAHVGGRDVFGSRVIMMATGSRHAACVTKDGTLWSWGDGGFGQVNAYVYECVHE